MIYFIFVFPSLISHKTINFNATQLWAISLINVQSVLKKKLWIVWHLLINDEMFIDTTPRVKKI
jgi:hypothetical protein